MKKFALFLFLSFSLPISAQTGTVQGLCSLGGTQASTSGLSSTNYLDGVIPSCTITVYLTGTTTKATIYSNASSAPLGNPFTGNAIGSVNAGGWLFWAATNQGLDVVMSGGIAPNTFPQPVTLTDVYPGTPVTVGGAATGLLFGTTTLTDSDTPPSDGQCLYRSGSNIAGTSCGGITLTTTGSSGAATLINGVLNIPVYSGGSSLPTCTTNQMLYYSADGSMATCLDLGTGLSISGGTLNSTGGGSGVGSNTYVFQAGSNGAACNEQTVVDGAVSATSTTLTSATGLFVSEDVGKTVIVNGAGAAGVDLVTTIAAYVSATQITLTAAASTTVSVAKVAWGGDDTAALNSLLGTVNSAVGGTIYIHGSCLVVGQVNVPNNGASTNPQQPSIRMTGIGGGSSNGAWTTPPTTDGTLDLRYNATYGKILTLGQGKLEIDHMTLKDGGTDCAAFIYTTNTTLAIHDNQFSGTAAGASACNDALMLGGTTTTLATLDPTDAFQGYNTYIDHNFFDKIRRAAWFRKFADAITFTHNTISKNCGATSGAAAVQLGLGNAQDARGNYFSGNLYEIEFYVYPIWIDGGSGNNFFGDNFWDASGSTLFLYHVTAGGQANAGMIYYDSSMSESKVSDDNQPGGSNSFLGYYAMGWALGRAVFNGQTCAGTGSGTSGTCTTTADFTPVGGTVIKYNVPATNTGSSYSITVNGFGPKPVAKWQTQTTLAAGDLVVGAYVTLVYDGTNWEMGPPGNAPTAAFSGGLGTSYQDVTETAAPASPSAGDDRLYLDSTSHTLSCKTSAGANCMPTTSGSITLENGGTSLGSATTLNCSTGTTCSLAGSTGTIIATSSSAFPFTVLQETFGSTTSGTSFTLTYPQTAAASGNTEFLVVGTGGTTVSVTGWTSDADYSPSLHVEVFHRTSAGESSATITTGVSTQIAVYYVELSGTRTFDTDVTFNNAPVSNGMLLYSVPNTSSITPTAGAWVIGATVYINSDTSSNAQTATQPSNPSWQIRLAPRPNASAKGLIIESAIGAASGSAVTPPPIQIYSGTLSNGANPATILFSIK